MHSPSSERRHARSDDAQTALTLQLLQARTDGRLTAVVLAGDDGLSIAGAGDSSLCSELAAVAPLLSRGQLMAQEVEIAQTFVWVRAVHFDGVSLYLASCGEDGDNDGTTDVDALLAQTGSGVARILSAAA